MIDITDLKKKNPELYRCIVAGRVLRAASPVLNKQFKDFPIKDKQERELAIDTIIGYSAMKLGNNILKMLQ